MINHKIQLLRIQKITPIIKNPRQKNKIMNLHINIMEDILIINMRRSIINIANITEKTIKLLMKNMSQKKQNLKQII